MGDLLFLIWYMIAILPYLIVLEAFEKLQKFMARRGYDLTWMHVLIFVLCVLFIILYLKGYRV